MANPDEIYLPQVYENCTKTLPNISLLCLVYFVTITFVAQ